MAEISAKDEEFSSGDTIFSLLIKVREEIEGEGAIFEQPAKELAEPLFALRINKPTAWIEFLKSNEKAILLKALDNLYEACRTYPELRKRLIERNVVNILVNKLVYSKVAVIKAHSLRLLAELLKCNSFSTPIKKLKKLSVHLIKMFRKSSLLVLQEYSSLVLSILSHKRELRRFMVITCCNDFEYFLLRLSSKDPDIQYNSLKIIYKMVQDKYCGQFIVNLQNFFFQRFFKLLKSDYLEIQVTAVDIILHLIRRNIKELTELFIEENGVNHLLNFLQEYTWREHHPKIFTTLRIVVKFNKEKIKLEKQWLDKLVAYIDFIGDDFDLIYQDLRLILRLSENIHNKTELTKTPIKTKAEALMLLMDTSNDLKLLLLRIFMNIPVKMDEVKPKNRCSDVMLTELLRIVNFNKCEGKLSRYAIAYIHSVVKVDEGTLKTLANENSYMGQLVEWLSAGCSLPYQFISSLLEIFKVFSQSPFIKRTITTKEIFKYLFTYVKINAEIEKILKVRICAANIIYNLLEDNGHKIYEQYFECVCSPATIVKLLSTIRDRTLIEWICKSIIAIIKKSESFTIQLIRKGCLKWIVTNYKLWNDCLPMTNLTNTFFNNFLPIKFEYTGFLDFQDFTKSGFYVQRCQKGNNSLDFPLLSDMINCDTATTNVIYIVCYDNVLQPEIFIDFEKKNEFHEVVTIPLGNIIRFVKKEERGNNNPMTDDDSSTKVDESKYISSRYYNIEDPRMTDYVKELKENVKPFTS
ncbi:uncharacterized protein isoform X3 [Rhodnius prolixus]